MSISAADKLSDTFKIGDLSLTSTGIANLPTEDVLPNMRKMAQALEKIKAKLGPFNIASGYRTPAVNAAVGGASTSRHLYGDAIDIVPLTKSAEQYWAEILADGNLKNLFGEISYKIYQNAIHLTLPYTNSSGQRVVASARTANNDTGSVIYKSTTADQVSQYLNKYGLTISASTITTAGIGMGVLILGGGALLLALAIKKRKNK